ncbi:thioredoxin-dependent thiol peroxidase [Paenibacillus protaetiae]|nr:thioredoxin-dependent thiol peroxidase [Paenibacillus protaetiae]
MAQVEIGKQVPDFTLPSGEGVPVSLRDYRGSKVIVYFYPKDSTPACTQEACDFRDSYEAFQGSGAAVIGISPDNARSHQRFADKQQLPFVLLTDAEHEVCELFGVWQLKKLYGREYMGLVRSTFLIDENGVLVREWRNVRVKGHVQQVLEAVRSGA